MGKITKELKKSLVTTANLMINGDIDIIQGSRLICSILPSFNYELIDEGLFLYFIAVESETDVYPIGNDRKHYAAEYLAELDQKRNDYIKRQSCDVIKHCHILIQVLEGIK